MSELGEVLALLPSVYILATERSEGEIVFALDPLKIRAIKGLAVIETGNLVWTSLGADRDDAIKALFSRCR
jgi:hypothetical protein